MEAVACHELGRVYHKQHQPEEAERHYREAARISEDRGRLDQAARPGTILPTYCRTNEIASQRPDNWPRKHATIAKCSGTRRCFSPRWPGWGSRPATEGP